MTTRLEQGNIAVALGLALGLALTWADSPQAQIKPAPASPNIQIVRIDCGQVFAGLPANCKVDVRNAGTAPSPATVVALEASGAGQSISAKANLASVAPNGQAQASTLVAFPQPGQYAVKASVGGATSSISVTAGPTPQITPGGLQTVQPGQLQTVQPGQATALTLDVIWLQVTSPPACGSSPVGAQAKVAFGFGGKSPPGFTLPQVEVVWKVNGQQVKTEKTPTASDVIASGIGSRLSPKVDLGKAVQPPTQKPPGFQETPLSFSFEDKVFILEENYLPTTPGTYDVQVEARVTGPLPANLTITRGSQNPRRASMVVQPPCDLEVVNLSFDKRRYENTEWVTATVTIRNNGPGVCCPDPWAPGGKWTEVTFENPPITQSDPITTLRPKATERRIFRFLATQDPNWPQSGVGIVRWTAKVNANQASLETAYGNNQKTESYEVVRMVNGSLRFHKQECDDRPNTYKWVGARGEGDDRWFDGWTLRNGWKVVSEPEFNDDQCHWTPRTIAGFGADGTGGRGAKLVSRPSPGSTSPALTVHWEANSEIVLKTANIPDAASGRTTDNGYSSRVRLRGPAGLSPCPVSPCQGSFPGINHSDFQFVLD